MTPSHRKSRLLVTRPQNWASSEGETGAISSSRPHAARAAEEPAVTDTATFTDEEIVYEDRRKRVEAVCNFVMPSKEIMKTKLSVDHREDEEVISFIEEYGGPWSKEIELPTALQLNMRRSKSLARFGSRMLLLGDSVLNLYRTRDGAETECAKVAAGYSGKTKGGYPRSKFVITA